MYTTLPLLHNYTTHNYTILYYTILHCFVKLARESALGESVPSIREVLYI